MPWKVRARVIRRHPKPKTFDKARLTIARDDNRGRTGACSLGGGSFGSNLPPPPLMVLFYYYLSIRYK